MQVDDCINKYLWLNDMNARLMQMKKEGKPIPSTPDEMMRVLGNPDMSSDSLVRLKHAGESVNI